MAYKDQVEYQAAEVQRSQGELAVFKEQIYLAEKEAADLKIQISELQNQCKTLTQERNTLDQIVSELVGKRSRIVDDLNQIVTLAVAKKQAELDALIFSQVTEPRRVLDAMKSMLDSEADEVSRREAAAEAWESALTAKAGILDELEASLAVREKAVESIEVQVKKDNAEILALLTKSEQEKSILAEKEKELQIKKQNLDAQSRDISEKTIALRERVSALEVREELMKDLEVRETRLAVDLADFEAAKKRIEDKENELKSLERDVRSRLADIKQQQQALSVQLKGEQS